MHSEWLQWYTLIFTLPAGLAIVLLLLIGVGSLGGEDDAGDGGDGDGYDAGGETDLGDGDAGDAFSADSDASGDGDGGDDGGDDGDGGDGHDGFHVGSAVRDVLGIGRAPLTIGGGGLLLGWGITGITALEILRPRLIAPQVFVPVAAVIAFVGATLFARFVSRVYVLVMPQNESSAVSRSSLVGLTGRVILPVSDKGGHIHVWDQYRTLHQEPARVAPGESTIPRGTEVVILDIEGHNGAFLVEPALPAEKPAPLDV